MLNVPSAVWVGTVQKKRRMAVKGAGGNKGVLQNNFYGRDSSLGCSFSGYHWGPLEASFHLVTVPGNLHVV